MGIQLLSVSHKVAPLEVRSYFAFDEEQQIQIMLRLKEHENIEETVIIATCNRTEVYVYAKEESDSRDIYEWIQKVVLEEASAEHIENIGDYLLLYKDTGAVHHCFKVAAGLDSMVIGEDQILGQVKRAHEFAHMHHLCKTYLNTLFRMAVTGAKKIKTDTDLSKTSVSTASLALKAAEKELGELKGKNLLIIGASGKIGNTVLKNANSMNGIHSHITVRTHGLSKTSNGHQQYEVVPYEERYHVLDEMDVIISATSSPHFTLTKYRVEKVLKTNKKRVFIDLAVPMDIEGSIADLANTCHYNIEDFKLLAEKNNKKKEREVKAAAVILEDYIEQFFKWYIFHNGLSAMDNIKKYFKEKAQKKGTDYAVEKFFYDVREECSVEELRRFFTLINKISI